MRIAELSVGARLAQTRRSIDVAGEVQREGSAVAFIVIGGQKCGTTLLYECLNQHPLVVRGRRRETHFFDWRWQDTLETAESQREFCERKVFFCIELEPGVHSPAPYLQEKFFFFGIFFSEYIAEVMRCRSHHRLEDAGGAFGDRLDSLAVSKLFLKRTSATVRNSPKTEPLSHQGVP